MYGEGNGEIEGRENEEWKPIMRKRSRGETRGEKEEEEGKKRRERRRIEERGNNEEKDEEGGGEGGPIMKVRKRGEWKKGRRGD